MKTNLVKKGLQSIYGGLQMLSENKTESLSTLAEISIILSNTEIRDRYQLDDNINELLGSMLFLIKDLTPESVKLVTDFVLNEEYKSNSSALDIDYKSKYEQTLEKLNTVNEELIELIGTINKRKPYQR